MPGLFPPEPGEAKHPTGVHHALMRLFNRSSVSLDAKLAIRAALRSFLVTRTVVVLAAGLGVSQLTRTYHKGLFTEAALMWDGAWYAGIAKDGYFLPPPPNASNLAFPPLLPFLTRLLGGFFGYLGFSAGDPDYGNWALAGIVISNLSFFAALYVLWRLVVLDNPPAVADQTLWLIAAFPVSVFWSALYTESLFLLLAVGCLFAARRNAWPVAGILGGLAVLSRWPGVVLIGVLLVEWLAARRASHFNLRGGEETSRPAVVSWKALCWIGLIPLALGCYAAYVQTVFGSPWLVLQARTQMGQSASLFPLTYIHGVSLLWQSVSQTGPDRDLVLQLGYGNSLYMWLDLGLPWVFVGLGIFGWRRHLLRPGDLAWLGLGLIFPLSLGTTFSLTRYLMPLWPALVIGARLSLHWPFFGRALLIGAAGMSALTAYLFANGKWIG